MARIHALLNELADTRRVYATYAADEQAVSPGWAAHVFFCHWWALYWRVRWLNRHG